MFRNSAFGILDKVLPFLFARLLQETSCFRTEAKQELNLNCCCDFPLTDIYIEFLQLKRCRDDL